MKSFLTILTTLALLPQTVFAWGDLGHETVAEIAEQIISQDPQLKMNIQAVVGVEPFAISAIWPDHARDDARFDDFAPYHYTTIFENPKQSAEKDAMTILQKYPNVLTSKTIPRESKMIAFRYLVHVVGDIHQPLHVGNEFDRGGNMCQVVWQPNADRAGTKTNLHSAWDTALVEHIAAQYKKLEPTVKYYGYKQLAKALMNKYKDEMPSAPSVNVQTWVNESAQLRLTRVYPDNLPANERPYCKQGKQDGVVQPVLDASYIASASTLAEKQMVLGGVRLAAFLKEIFKNANEKNPVETEVLNLLKLTNHE